MVEQAPGLPFNRGALINVGFRLLGSEVDYICLHDVDRIPIEADYGWPERPLMIIRHGLPLSPNLIDVLLSSVVLMQSRHFAAANGFSNSYWGWGFEDTELRLRCMFGGIGFERRDGTYYPLPHDDPAFSPTNELTEPARKTFALYESRRPRMAALMREDGLTNLNFTRLDTRAHEAASTGNIFHHLVDIGGPE